jgi:hypothetical protein
MIHVLRPSLGTIVICSDLMLLNCYEILLEGNGREL